MRFSNLKHDKGVAGLTILLSLITMLFVIGLLVMIFSLMGGELATATYTSTSGTVYNESAPFNTTRYANLSVTSYRGVRCTIISITNSSIGNQVIASGNYTVNNCGINNLTATFVDRDWKVDYSYVYDADNTATSVINETTSGISGVTDWYPIFIVIGAMVVLILLTVLIITAIRGSGMMGGTTNATGTQNVGSA